MVSLFPAQIGASENQIWECLNKANGQSNMQRRRISDTPVGMMHLACPGGRFWFVLHCIVVVLCPYCMCTVLAHSFSFFLSQPSIVENDATVAEYSYASLISGESGAEL